MVVVVVVAGFNRGRNSSNSRGIRNKISDKSFPLKRTRIIFGYLTIFIIYIFVFISFFYGFLFIVFFLVIFHKIITELPDPESEVENIPVGSKVNGSVLVVRGESVVVVVDDDCDVGSAVGPSVVGPL